jgi:hypothetical protein
VVGLDNNRRSANTQRAAVPTIVREFHLDFETATWYSLTVEVFDGVYATAEDFVVEVLDVPETKFFVVDTSRDSTFEYAAAGAGMGDCSLGGGNNAPRGATADVTGTTVWVVDKDKYVHVYDADRALRGKWKANGPRRPDGIATDGNDIWIADSRNDRVCRYDAAAGRTSGSLSASSSLPLTSGNKNPKGITSDGNHLWIVNSAGNDKVFKYTVSGTPLGSWSLDPGNSRPEGITIDPSDVDTIWVVDRDADAVFPYTGGTARTAGSQQADDGFALAANNYNPRGIADPPPPVMVFSSRKTTPTRSGDVSILLGSIDVLPQMSGPLTRLQPVALGRGGVAWLNGNQQVPVQPYRFGDTSHSNGNRTSVGQVNALSASDQRNWFFAGYDGDLLENFDFLHSAVA